MIAPIPKKQRGNDFHHRDSSKLSLCVSLGLCVFVVIFCFDLGFRFKQFFAEGPGKRDESIRGFQEVWFQAATGSQSGLSTGSVERRQREQTDSGEDSKPGNGNWRRSKKADRRTVVAVQLKQSP
jgi:hypothetical protein